MNLIDRADVKRLLLERAYDDGDIDMRVDELIDEVNEIPTYPARPKGKWENIDIIHDRKDAKITDWQQAQCSVCGKWHTTPYLYSFNHYSFCPNCGAEMEVGE